MPLYEFHCAGCNGEFEDLVRTPAEMRAVRCPKCNGKKVERKMSVFGVGGSARTGGSSCGSCSASSCSGCGHH